MMMFLTTVHIWKSGNNNESNFTTSLMEASFDLSFRSLIIFVIGLASSFFYVHDIVFGRYDAVLDQSEVYVQLPDNTR
jgi:hypothetical protein